MMIIIYTLQNIHSYIVHIHLPANSFCPMHQDFCNTVYHKKKNPEQ